MSITKNILVYTAILSLIAVSAIYIASVTLIGQASAPSGLVATNASSSIISLSSGAGYRTLFEPNTTCTSRIISTASSSIRLAFEPNIASGANGVASTTLTRDIGFFQDASTTIAYDSGIYGCGWVSAYSDNSDVIDINVLENN